VKAVVYSSFGGTPVLTEVAAPACPDGGVVLRVGATGVCRSDWHAWQGHDPVALPHIPGHELAGLVAQTGPAVTRWRVGDRVTVPFVCGCGVCEYCLRGDAQVCPDQTQPGFTGPGSFAELVAIQAADANLVSLPDSVDFVTAASLGCRFATAFRALTVHGRIGTGDWLAVHGCGGVGLSAVMIGAALGARVVAVDVSVDALGSPATAISSVRCLRRRGRHLQVGLLLGAASAPPLPMDLVVARELEIYGSHGMAARAYPPLLALVADRTLRPDLLVGEVIGLADAGAALAAMGQPSSSAGITVVELPL
jgi:alcohol dehydrogenase